MKTYIFPIPEMFLNLFYGYHMVDFVKEEYEETEKEDHEGLLLKFLLINIASVFCFEFLISISFQGHFQENNRPIESIN